jgi:hypothetical protein
MLERLLRHWRPAVFGLISVGCFVAAAIVLSSRLESNHSSSPLPPSSKRGDRRAANRAHRVLKAIWAPLRLPDGSSVFPLLHALDVDVLQVQLAWRQTAPRRPAHPANPNDPAYAWPHDLDQVAAMAARYRVQLAIMVKDSPSWANEGRPPQWAPTDDADYANFLVAAARRYPEVRRWMIWGEVNRGHDFQPMPPDSPVGPRRYARLLAAAYRALKTHDRRDIVVGGMTFTYGIVKPPDFVRWLRLPSGSRPPLDEWGHNPYSRRRPQLNARLSYPGARDLSDMPLFVGEVHAAYRSLRRFRTSGPALWLSEFTVSSDHPNRSFTFATSRREQARWLTSAFRVAMRTRAVSGLGWFNLLDDPQAQPLGLTTGLLTHDGEPKPAYAAYRRVP